MRGVYLDNFRGFTNQFIDLKGVNFLVGENSTGKTSLLAAIKTLGSSRFWFLPTFDDPDLPFSSFSEIVSKSGAEKKCFTIGYFNNERPKDATYDAFRLVRFKDVNGFPSVDKYCFICDAGLVVSVIRDGGIDYKLFEVHPASSSDLIALCSKEMNAARFAGFKKIRSNSFSKNMLFANAPQLIEADIAGNKKKRAEFTFNFETDGPTCRWIAPIRAKPEKIYLGRIPEYSAEGAHIPYVLNKILADKAGVADKKLLGIVNNFGKNSGLFDAVKIKKFGRGVLAPFEVNVEIGGNSLVLGSVGYGVSQVLPVILEATRRHNSSFIAIQQPEVHLHPRAQASLGEFLFECHTEKGIQYLIETHSDFLIDRFRLCMNKSELECEAQVLFFDRIGNQNKVYNIDIDKDGRYPDEQPEEFRAFFLNEELSLLRV